jgi:hypothetical protein
MECTIWFYEYIIIVYNLWLYQNDVNNLFMLNCLQYKGNYIIFMHVHNFDILYTKRII